MPTNTLSAREPSARRGCGRRLRQLGRHAVVLATILAIETAGAQSLTAQAQADCDVVRQVAEAARQAEVKPIDDREKLTAQAIANAKSCIDRILQTIRAMTPGLPGIADLSIQQIINYMSNKLCAVATQQVTAAVGNVTNPINGAINSAVGQVNGAVNGALPPVLQGAVPQVITTNPVGAGAGSGSNGSNVWDRMGCMVGRGANCPK